MIFFQTFKHKKLKLSKTLDTDTLKNCCKTIYNKVAISTRHSDINTATTTHSNTNVMIAMGLILQSSRLFFIAKNMIR